MLGQDAFIRGAELHHEFFLFIVCHKGDVHTLSSFMYALSSDFHQRNALPAKPLCDMQTGQRRAVVGVLYKRLALRCGQRDGGVVRYNAEQRQPHAVHHIIDRRTHAGKQLRNGPVDDKARRDLPLLQQ